MVEETVEKKLTEEEVLKVIQCCYKHEGSCEDCPLNAKGLSCNTDMYEDLYDMIQRLQSENAEQKTEIERLTEENGELRKDVYDMSWIIKIHKYCVGADHCQNSSAREFELQKQVDELSKANIDLWNANQLGVKYAKNPYKGVEVE